jgi:hypothetical protein
MQTSPELKNLTAALVKAQAAFPAIPKDKEVQAGARRYRYSDLATIVDKTRKPLTDAGLAITMGTEMKDGNFLLTCRLSHSTGEWMESQYPMPKDQGSQVIGAAMTYGRRYLLSAILNICADDDTDGEEAKDVPHGNGKSFTTDPRQAAKDAKKEAAKTELKPDATKPNAGLASVNVKSIQPIKISGVEASMLKTSGGDFIVDPRKPTSKDILMMAQKASMSGALVVIDFVTSEATGNNLVSMLRMEG